jgi:hypothetical protein
MKARRSRKTLSTLEQYYTTDIFIFNHAVKIPYIRKDWD